MRLARHQRVGDKGAEGRVALEVVILDGQGIVGLAHVIDVIRRVGQEKVCYPPPQHLCHVLDVGCIAAEQDVVTEHPQLPTVDAAADLARLWWLVIAHGVKLLEDGRCIEAELAHVYAADCVQLCREHVRVIARVRGQLVMRERVCPAALIVQMVERDGRHLLDA